VKLQRLFTEEGGLVTVQGHYLQTNPGTKRLEAHVYLIDATLVAKVNGDMVLRFGAAVRPFGNSELRRSTIFNAALCAGDEGVPVQVLTQFQESAWATSQYVQLAVTHVVIGGEDLYLNEA